MRKIILLFMLLLFFLVSLDLSAQELSSEKMILFADSLYEKSDYYRAITEYERLIFYYPESILVKKARFQIAMAYFKGEKYDVAISDFIILVKKYEKDEVGKKALYMLGESYYLLKEFELSSEYFDEYNNKYPKDKLHDNATIRKGDALLRQGMWSEAIDTYNKIPSLSKFRETSDTKQGLCLKYSKLKKKSPAVAGCLSTIVPGAGQLYLGRSADAAVAFIINSVLILATINSFDNGNSVAGIFLLGVETAFYSGTIYNAKSGAYKYNQHTEKLFFKNFNSRNKIFLSSERKVINLLTFNFLF